MGFYNHDGKEITKVKLITGTTGTTTTDIAHGLVASDIVNINIVVEDSTGAFAPPVYSGNTADLSHYAMYWDNTNIKLEAQGSQIDVRPYMILITYLG